MMGSLALAAVVSAGCATTVAPEASPPAPKAIAKAVVKPGEEGSLMPLARGNQWIYVFEKATVDPDGAVTEEGKGEMTWRVTNTNEVSEGVEGTIQVMMDGEVKDQQIWRVDSKGVFQIQGGLDPARYIPPQPVIKFPVKTGASFEWTGTGATAIGNGRQSTKTKILGAEEVDTESSRVSAIAFETYGDFGSGEMSGKTFATAWFQPGIGLVRYRAEVAMGALTGITTLKLKSTNINQP